MNTEAVRLYAAHDLRLERFELPPMGDDELTVKIICDSLCMSSFKAAEQGAGHKRVPDDVAKVPVIIGHEFCGVITAVGEKWKHKYSEGQRFSIQPALKNTFDAVGYSFQSAGGNSQYAILPACYMEQGNVLPYNGEAFFYGSLAEPLSCVIGAAHASYHTTQGEYVHKQEIVSGGKMAILAGAGPMGLALIDYILHREAHLSHKPSLLVVTDIDDQRLSRASILLSPAEAEKEGVELVYINTARESDPISALKGISGGGFDDVFVFAPVSQVVEQGDAILAYDGCLNFFAGPTDKAFSSKLNFYNVHYNATHIVGTTGGNTDDMREALDLASKGRINPAMMVTHIGGLDSVIDATLNLPKIPGGKKLIYSGIDLPLTEIAEFENIGKSDPLFATLHDICARYNGLWNVEAERFLFKEKGPQY